MQTPCGSAVLAPSAVEAIVACQPPAPQIGSAQAARRTAPTRARSSPRRQRHPPSCKEGVAPWNLRPWPASGPPATSTPHPTARPPISIPPTQIGSAALRQPAALQIDLPWERPPPPAALTQSPPLRIHLQRGRQPPPGPHRAKPHRLITASNRARYGPPPRPACRGRRAGATRNTRPSPEFLRASAAARDDQLPPRRSAPQAPPNCCPPSRASLGAPPVKLAHPPPRAPPAVQPPRRRQPPPADWLRKLRQTAPALGCVSWSPRRSNSQHPPVPRVPPRLGRRMGRPASASQIGSARCAELLPPPSASRSARRVQLARPPPRAPPAVQPPRRRQPPPADWLRKLRQTAPVLGCVSWSPRRSNSQHPPVPRVPPRLGRRAGRPTSASQISSATLRRTAPILSCEPECTPGAARPSTAPSSTGDSVTAATGTFPPQIGSAALLQPAALKIDLPWGRPPPPTSLTQSPPLKIHLHRGWQPPPGARTVRSLIAFSQHRTGHDTGPTPSPASRIAPPVQLLGHRPPAQPAVERSWSRHLSAAQIGSASSAELPTLVCESSCPAGSAPRPPSPRSTGGRAVVVPAPFRPADRLHKLRRTARLVCEPSRPAGSAPRPPSPRSTGGGAVVVPAPFLLRRSAPLRSAELPALVCEPSCPAGSAPRPPPPLNRRRSSRGPGTFPSRRSAPQAPPNCPPLSARPRRRRHPPSCKAGVSALEPAAVKSRPPVLPARPPQFHIRPPI
jgi:hypothetical protein